MRRLRHRDQAGHAAAAALVAGPRAGRVADGLGDQTADRVIGAADPAGRNTEERDLLRCGRSVGDGHQGEYGQKRGYHRAHRAHSPDLPFVPEFTRRKSIATGVPLYILPQRTAATPRVTFRLLERLRRRLT